MTVYSRSAKPHPLFSVILCVYNDWKPLEQFLKSLTQQVEAPGFELILVDDGSDHEAPQSLLRASWGFPVRFLRQNHAGLAVARNTGILAASGEIFLFSDCDCILQPDCLRNLEKGISRFHRDNCFQLHLKGDPSSLVGRAEELRLSTIQTKMLLPDGRIHYFNTAGCAIRRTLASENRPLFDDSALRAQDTLLFADLIAAGEFPRYLPDAVVQHSVNLTVPKYVWKALRTGYVEGKTYAVISTIGVSVRSSNSQRIQILLFMLKHSLARSLGIAPFIIVTVRQSVSLMGSILYRLLSPTSAGKQHFSGLRVR